MPNFTDLANRLELIINDLPNQLQNDLPSFDEAEFFQVFGKKLEDNLTLHGKNTYGIGINQDVLKSFFEKVHKSLSEDHTEILNSALTDILKNLDPKTAADSAQEQFELKSNSTKESLSQKFHDELTKQGLEFDNPSDKQEFITAFNNYFDAKIQKYKDNLNEVNSIWPNLMRLVLHGQKLKNKAKNSDFTIEKTDLRQLPIGTAPEAIKGFRLNKENLAEILLYLLANPGKPIHLILTVPDRDGIIRQIGEIGIQCRSPAVAFLAVMLFYFLAKIFNNDVERMVKTFENVIKEKKIPIDPNDVSITIKQVDSNGKLTTIKEKGHLSPEDSIRLQKINQEVKEEYKESLKRAHESDEKTNLHESNLSPSKRFRHLQNDDSHSQEAKENLKRTHESSEKPNSLEESDLSSSKRLRV